MTPQDIVKTGVERTMPNANWKEVYAHIQLMVKSPQHRIFRANNTLFVIDNHGDHTADVVFMLTADPITTMPSSVHDGLQAMKKCQFTELTFNSSRPAFLRMIQRAGYTPRVFPPTNQSGATVKVAL